MLTKRGASFALLWLLLAALACNLPATGWQDQSPVFTAAQQTIVAQNAAATVTVALDQAAGATQTALAATAIAGAAVQTQAAQATDNALSAVATAQAGGALVTQTAQSAAATQAQAAQTTALWLAATQTQAAQTTALWLAATQTAQAFPTLPPPPSPSGAGMNRIQFASGATSAYVEGELKKGAQVEYVVRALKGQTMMIDVISPNHNVYLGVVGLTDGVPLMRPVAAGTSFNQVLPATQDYRIWLASPDQKSTYGMSVIVPARIQFAPGAISASVPGSIPAFGTNYYLAWANAGQTMTVVIASPGNNVLLTIYGLQDGQPLVRSVSGATSWTGVLPGSQDYMIQAVSSGAPSSYTIQLTVQ